MNIFKCVYSLFLTLPRKYLLYFVGILFLGLVSSFFELLALASLLPFLESLTNGESNQVKILGAAFPIEDSNQFFLPTIIVVVWLTAALAKTVLLWSSARIAFISGNLVCKQIFSDFLMGRYYPNTIAINK